MESISLELRKAAGEDLSAGSGGESPFGKCVTRRDGTPVDGGLVKERELGWKRGGWRVWCCTVGSMRPGEGSLPGWLEHKMLPSPFVGCHSQASCVSTGSPFGDTHAHPPCHSCVCAHVHTCVHVYIWACSFRLELSLKGYTKNELDCHL